MTTGVPFLTCPLLALTGLDCPFCGGTRSSLALVRGDLIEALDYNALWIVALPLVVWLAAARLSARVGGPALPSPVVTPRMLRWAAVVLVAFAVVRNLPIAPFAALKA